MNGIDWFITDLAGRYFRMDRHIVNDTPDIGIGADSLFHTAKVDASICPVVEI